MPGSRLPPNTGGPAGKSGPGAAGYRSGYRRSQPKAVAARNSEPDKKRLDPSLAYPFGATGGSQGSSIRPPSATRTPRLAASGYTASARSSPDFSQGDGVPSVDCHNPKPHQTLTGDLRSGAKRQGVFVACARAAPARLGKMLHGLANYATRDAARVWW